MFSKVTNNGGPPLPAAPCLEASRLSQHQSSNKKRKVVRFEEEEGEDTTNTNTNTNTNTTRRVKRRIRELHDVPTSSDMTLEEKSQKWRQSSDHIATIVGAQQVARLCQSSFDNRCVQTNHEDGYMLFAESIITTFNLCNAETSTTADELPEGACQQDQQDENNFDDDADIDKANAQRGLPLDQMILFGDHQTSARGLENTILRGLGARRLTAKREHVEFVLYVQDHLRALSTSATDLALGIGASSRCLSAPSKRFARAMGVVDGTLALLEYASSDSPAATPNTVADEELQRNSPLAFAVTDFEHLSSSSSSSSCDGLETLVSTINNAPTVSVA